MTCRVACIPRVLMSPSTHVLFDSKPDLRSGSLQMPPVAPALLAAMASTTASIHPGFRS